MSASYSCFPTNRHARKRTSLPLPRPHESSRDAKLRPRLDRSWHPSIWTLPIHYFDLERRNSTPKAGISYDFRYSKGIRRQVSEKPLRLITSLISSKYLTVVRIWGGKESKSSRLAAINVSTDKSYIPCRL